MMIKFPSIDSFKSEYHNIRKYCNNNRIKYPVLNYTGTVKLHGSNAGIHLLANNTLIAQSRIRELSIGSDNYGWAQEVYKNKEVIKSFIKFHFGDNNDIYIFGERIGKGIQKKVAITDIDPKQFVILAIWLNGKWLQNMPYYKLPEYNIRNILEVPEYHVTIDFGDPVEALVQVEQFTLEVEQQCPWGHLHGFDGLGEGIVWKHVGEFSSIFKTKGVKHKGGKDTSIKPPRIDENDYIELVEHILPDWRLEQGIQFLIENEIDITKKYTGNYLKFIAEDILKEEKDILVEFDKPWKVVVQYINTIAKKYYFLECDKI